MEDRKRQILTEVAAGTLSPEQAAQRLDELERQYGETRSEVREETAGSGGPAARIRLAGTFGRAIVVGDPNVKEARVEGYHVARREGDILVIETGRREDWWDFSFGRGGRRGWPAGFNPWRSQELRVAMNPLLPLEVELLAGQLEVRGVRARMRVQVSAGSARIDDFVGPIDLEVMSGSVRARGLLNEGASRIRCDMGSVRLGLRGDSSVRISARAMMGKVAIPGPTGNRNWGMGGLSDEQTTTLGSGAGSLEVETNMGSVNIEVLD